MYLLAKLGFNNSYTYFTWRNSKEELQSYMMELTRSNVVEYFRPSFWPNTPDILHEYLAGGGRPAHVIRYILAATLSPVYGVYGPPFEHVNATQHAEREEYAHNEKYELRLWNWNDPDSLQPLFRRINRIRKDNVALQQLRSIHFLDTRNPLVLGYWKQSGTNLILCVIQSGSVPASGRRDFVAIARDGALQRSGLSIARFACRRTEHLAGTDGQHALGPARITCTHLSRAPLLAHGGRL